MDLFARASYLETQVNTATPQRLRLMLIEAALRHAQAAQQAWTDERPADATESLIRCRDIITELLAGIRPDDTPVVRQTLGIYAFLFSALTEVQQTRDPHQLAGIIRVLAEEQLTWQEVCLALPERVMPEQASAIEEELAPQRVDATFPDLGSSLLAAPAAGLSLEA